MQGKLPRNHYLTKNGLPPTAPFSTHRCNGTWFCKILQITPKTVLPRKALCQPSYLPSLALPHLRNGLVSYPPWLLKSRTLNIIPCYICSVQGQNAFFLAPHSHLLAAVITQCQLMKKAHTSLTRLLSVWFLLAKPCFSELGSYEVNHKQMFGECLFCAHFGLVNKTS